MKMKKAALPFLLVLLLLQAGCDKGETYDITGSWSFLQDSEEQFAFTFQGSSEKGILIPIDRNEGAGTYTVSEGEVAFQFVSTLIGGKSCDFLGVFVSEDRIEGNLEIMAPHPPFSWTIAVVGVRE